MRTNFNFTNSIAIIIMFTLVSCSKPEDGAIGPAGTANVIYSNWVTPSSYAGSATLHNQTIFNNNKDIYNASMNGGTVLVYWNQPNNGNSVLQLNITWSQGLYMEYSMPNNGVTSDIDIATNQPNYDGIGHTDRFRYIIIPGGTPATTGKQAQPDFKKMSYNEVCKYWKIPE